MKQKFRINHYILFIALISIIVIESSLLFKPRIKKLNIMSLIKKLMVPEVFGTVGDLKFGGSGGALNSTTPQSGSMLQYEPGTGKAQWVTPGNMFATDGTNLNVDAGTMFVNGTSNLVGIGTTVPRGIIDVSNPGYNIDGLVINPDANGDNSTTIQAYIDNQYANRVAYAGGCCNNIALQPDVGTITIGSNPYNPPNKFSVFGTSYFSNNVGIGTSAPGAKLDVAGTTKLAGTITLTDAAYFLGAPSYGFRFNDNGSNYNNFIIYENGNTYTRGNVGIGTTSPQAKLNINLGAGDGNVGTPAIHIGGTDNYRSLELGIKGAYDGMISTYGNDLHIYAGNWKTNGANSSENHKIWFYTSQAGNNTWQTAKMVLDSAGNVGIGTTAPAAKLDVAGATSTISNAAGDINVAPASGTLKVQGQAVSSNFKYVASLSDWRNNTGTCATGTWCAIPGRSLTFTKTRANSLIRFTYQDTLGNLGTDYGQCIWRVLIDGNTYLYFSEADGPSRGTSWVMSNSAHMGIASGLSAASHTITVQNYRASTECLSGWNTASTSWLGIEEVGP